MTRPERAAQRAAADERWQSCAAHADMLAALALHDLKDAEGRALGFTRADAERIRWVLREVDGLASWVDPQGYLDTSLYALADRIEALLPPEGP